jgi:hypothetical protein
LALFYGDEYGRVNVDGTSWGLAAGNKAFDDMVRRYEEVCQDFDKLRWEVRLHNAHWDQDLNRSTISTDPSWCDERLGIYNVVQPSSQSAGAAAALADLGGHVPDTTDVTDVVHQGAAAPENMETMDAVDSMPDAPDNIKTMADVVQAAVDSMAV